MAKAQTNKLMESIVSLAKRRGFVYPSSEIYGGLANTWDYGPLGAILKNNIKMAWWHDFIQTRMDMVGLDAAIFMNPEVWVAAGHVASFNDALVDCTNCKNRFRADHLIEDKLNINAEGLSIEDMNKIIEENGIMCPICGGPLTKVRKFNTMFSTHLGPVADDSSIIYLRPETCQAIFVDFKNILNSTRKKLPFGVGQIGKAFRNEITPGNFIFRVLELEQMEIEYFVKPGEDMQYFDKWLKRLHDWDVSIGLNPDHLHYHEHGDGERAFYSAKTIDIMYDFPFGRKELQGIADRTDYDLKQHMKFSGQDLSYFDEETKQSIVPFVIEPSSGVDRMFLALLCDAYEEEEIKEGDVRTVLHFNPRIAPVKAAVLPLMKKDGLDEKAKEIAQNLMKTYSVQYDETGSIGKRYRRQDEIGTPVCITVDYDSLKDDTVTVRDRDSMEQKRVKIADVETYIASLVTA
jgi:glycyl-tRNA synthetase